MTTGMATSPTPGALGDVPKDNKYSYRVSHKDIPSVWRAALRTSHSSASQPETNMLADFHLPGVSDEEARKVATAALRGTGFRRRAPIGPKPSRDPIEVKVMDIKELGSRYAGRILELILSNNSASPYVTDEQKEREGCIVTEASTVAEVANMVDNECLHFYGAFRKDRKASPDGLVGMVKIVGEGNGLTPKELTNYLEAIKFGIVNHNQIELIRDNRSVLIQLLVVDKQFRAGNITTQILAKTYSELADDPRVDVSMGDTCVSPFENKIALKLIFGKNPTGKTDHDGKPIMHHHNRLLGSAVEAQPVYDNGQGRVIKIAATVDVGFISDLSTQAEIWSRKARDVSSH
jgi:hypothetical protein